MSNKHNEVERAQALLGLQGNLNQGALASANQGGLGEHLKVKDYLAHRRPFETKLVRVRLNFAADAPGDSVGRSPKTESIYETFPKMGRDYYHLVVTHLVDGVPVVQITNPKSGITESIPWHCVMQCTPWTDELVEALTKDPNRRKEALDK